jgi:hypothetical protein
VRDVERLKDSVVEAGQATALTVATVKTLTSLSEGKEPHDTLGLEQLAVSMKALSKCHDEVSTRMDSATTIARANMQIHPFLFDWMLAMMVTFAEAYLEQALILLTTANPALMATNEKVLSGDDVLKIGAELGDQRWQRLLEVMRQRWTAQFLRGKPGEWIARLEKFGGPKYRAGLDAELTTIWNRRHAIVHTAPALLSDHSTGLAKSAKKKYGQSERAFLNSVKIIYSFVEATDAFILDVVSAKRSSDPVFAENRIGCE